MSIIWTFGFSGKLDYHGVGFGDRPERRAMNFSPRFGLDGASRPESKQNQQEKQKEEQQKQRQQPNAKEETTSLVGKEKASISVLGEHEPRLW